MCNHDLKVLRAQRNGSESIVTPLSLSTTHVLSIACFICSPSSTAPVLPFIHAAGATFVISIYPNWYFITKEYTPADMNKLKYAPYLYRNFKFVKLIKVLVVSLRSGHFVLVESTIGSRVRERLHTARTSQ